MASAVRRDTIFLEGCSWTQFIQILTVQLGKVQGMVLFNDENRMVKSRDYGSNKKFKTTQHENNNFKNTKTPTSTRSTCDGCGKSHGGERSDCFFINHPDFNQNGPWESSESGKFYKSLNPDKPHLDHMLVRSGNELIDKPRNNGNKNKNNNHKNKNFHKSKCILCSMNNNSNTNNSIVYAFLKQKNNNLRVQTLLDTGAESVSFISAKTATWLTSQGAANVNKQKVVCSCFGDCKYIDRCFVIPITFDNNVNNKNTFQKQTSIILNFWVIDKLPYDVIIGN